MAGAAARRAQRVQARVGVPFLLENVSTYIDVGGDLTEAEFVADVMDRCECGLLLDLTNVYNNAINLGGDPTDFIDAIPSNGSCRSTSQHRIRPLLQRLGEVRAQADACEQRDEPTLS